MTPDRDPPFSLTRGSKYKIISAETRDHPLVTEGTFLGFSSIGPDEAFVLELGESHGEEAGRTRVIPLHMILAIDVIEVAEEEDEVRPPEKMFG